MLQMTTNSAEETKELAKNLSKWLQAGSIISLKGQLGSGKTTFSQGLGKALGVKRALKSPTYTIVKQYPLNDEGLVLNHIDAYRLEFGGADSVDLESFFDNDSITIIEWAEFVLDYMPENYLEIELKSLEGDRRIVSVKTVGQSEIYEQLMTEWTQDWKGK